MVVWLQNGVVPDEPGTQVPMANEGTAPLGSV